MKIRISYALLILLAFTQVGCNTPSEPLLEIQPSDIYSSYTYESFSVSTAGKRVIDYSNIDYTLLGAAIFYATNEQRVATGHSRFVYSHVLYKAAYLQSSEMHNYGYFDHVSPVAGHETFTDRIGVYGKWYGSAGENIAMSSVHPVTYWDYGRYVLNLWMNSAGHRANIENDNFKRLGAAGYGTNTVYSTQVFANSTND